MLRHLTVRDFALVREVRLDFHDGLTVLTGESGAGKTILLEALGLVMGDRANVSHIRPGAERSEVSAEFDLTANTRACEFLTVRGLNDVDAPERCILRRIVSKEGRSRAFINGSPVNLADLEELTRTVIDIHAQNEHQQLLRRTVQLELLDDYASLQTLRADVGAAFHTWHELKRELDAATARTTAARDRRALLDYQVTELSEAALEDGEYATLNIQFRRLARLQETRDKVAQSIATLDGDDDVASAHFARLLRTLEEIDDTHRQLEAARDLLRTAITHLDEAGNELRHYADSLEAEPTDLTRIESRLDLITALARKHRVRPETLPEHARSLTAELESITADEDSLAALQLRVETSAAHYRGLAQNLSAKRRRSAKAFERAVGELMRELGIKGGALEVVFSLAESESGIDAADYHVRTNPKFPAGPLRDIASGGERSRISLAIQVVAAAKARLPALVLDEADVGIGGTTADVVGRLLRDLAQHTQVLCVTHAPQVAARGTHHLRVGKTDSGETFLEPLLDKARIEELARMLGGREITKKTREYAEELINAGAV
jgi:DNA repair protein RecN (Recombination protein N)